MNQAQVFIGIDVSKAKLDVASRPTSEQWEYSNDTVGIADCRKRREVLRFQWFLPVRLHRCLWWWSTPDRFETLRKPQDNWHRGASQT